jgi:hypothetical protein
MTIHLAVITVHLAGPWTAVPGLGRPTNGL